MTSAVSDAHWWLCPCGFDAKAFEPRPEAQYGAMKWHKALHHTGRAWFPEDDRQGSIPPAGGEG